MNHSFLQAYVKAFERGILALPVEKVTKILNLQSLIMANGAFYSRNVHVLNVFTQKFYDSGYKSCVYCIHKNLIKPILDVKVYWHIKLTKKYEINI